MNPTFLDTVTYPETAPGERDLWAATAVDELLTRQERDVRWLVLCAEVSTEVWMARIAHASGMQVFCDPSATLREVWDLAPKDRSSVVVSSLAALGTQDHPVYRSGLGSELVCGRIQDVCTIMTFNDRVGDRTWAVRDLLPLYTSPWTRRYSTKIYGVGYMTDDGMSEWLLDECRFLRRRRPRVGASNPGSSA